MPSTPRLSALEHLRRADSAIALVFEFMGDTPTHAYDREALLRSAVERQLIAIGEAASKLLEHHPLVAEHITDADDLRVLRNDLAHGNPLSRQTVIGHLDGLPQLRTEVRALLR